MPTMKETLAGAIVRNIIEPMAGQELRNTCFNVAIKNDHGEIDVRIRGCE